jgi:hypothetical protein
MRNHCAIVLLAALAGCDSSSPPQDEHAPFLVDSTPPEGEIITSTGADPGEISAVLGDENISDQLYLRLLVDYPSGSGSPAHLVLTASLPPTGDVTRLPFRMLPQCGSLHLGPGLHRVMLSVSDRPFLDALMGDSVDPEAPLDSVPPDVHRLRTVWLLNCP